NTGVLPYQSLRELVRAREVFAVEPIEPEQFQPASLDLRLGHVAYRVRASFLPGAGATVQQKIQQFGMHEIDLTKGAVLEKGCVYIVPLMEQLALSSRIAGIANPKSSTGRLDVFTRVIADGATVFDRIDAGYDGRLYIEIAPRTFSILVRKGSRLVQLRLRRGAPSSNAAGLRRLQETCRLVDVPAGQETIRDDTIGVTLDLSGDPATRLVGFRAKQHTGIVDVDVRQAYDPSEYWDPIHTKPGTGIILDPDDFYILATKEFVRVPPDHAAEMVAYDTLVGEFRVHYAGFFDPGFGWNAEGEPGSKAVLEVRSHEVPFVLEHEQIVGWLRYERLTSTPDRLYGQGIGSHYQAQGLQLGKQFKPYL
ncbi:MAG TPA: 2'-deoxycytidine 5'-triphosphate deaminase, partial [Candidatus Acidoferrum sp.]|nr:2'-deoxycytidine 5'-triphosphate deaminase [Candidatus Acidoferrum sp.]